MGSEFLVYLRLGFEHIADLKGYDHILFIVALTAMYPPREWRRVLVLVTAFTVGHSITLALATLDLVRIDADLVELLIPVTILVAALLNIGEVGWQRSHAVDEGGGDGGSGPETDPEPAGGRITKYVLALVFGLIHGLGFSNFLRAMLGGAEGIALPLLAFNIGLEVGQIVIVMAVMTTTGIAVRALRVPRAAWTLTLSSATGVAALYLIWVRLFVAV